jgi:hypothetical protein
VGLGQLHRIRLSGNSNLTSLTLPPGLTNLTGIFLRSNHLTNLALPPDLGKLTQIDALGNQLAHINLPNGLTNLETLILSGNQLTALTIPRDMTNLSSLVLQGNPLDKLVLPGLLADGDISGDVDFLRTNGVQIFAYSLSIGLMQPLAIEGRIDFMVSGPPGIYAVYGSSDFSVWSVVGIATNTVGTISFSDFTSGEPPQRFYTATAHPLPTDFQPFAKHEVDFKLLIQ